jgi:large subunit ribosomal protein L14
MIQIGTVLNIVDNSGGKRACCIRIINGSKNRYAFLGDLILVSIKSLRKRRRALSKVKKGEIHKALIIRTKFKSGHSFADRYSFLENAIILFNKQNKFLGNRIFGSVIKNFRYSKYMRLISMSSGVTL